MGNFTMASGETGKGRDGWDEFVQRANEFIGSGELEKNENDFKRAMACNLRKAREALLTGTGNLAELVEKGLTGNLIYFGIRMNFREWMDKFPDKAKETLSAIWTKDDLTVDQRIHAFCEEFPRGGNRWRCRNTHEPSIRLADGAGRGAVPALQDKCLQKGI